MIKLKKFIHIVIISLLAITLFLNIKHCKNQKEEKKESVHQVVRKQALNYSEEWTRYYRVDFGYLAEDYKYIAVDLSNGEVIALNDDYTYYETLEQGVNRYATTDFIKSIPEILANKGDTETIDYFEFMMKYYFNGNVYDNSLETTIYYNFMLHNNQNDFLVIDTDIPITKYQGDLEPNKIESANISTNGTIFNQNYNDIFMIFSTNYGTGFQPQYLEFFIDYSSFYVETPGGDYLNLFNDFIDLKYQEEYSAIIGQLQANIQGLQEENISLNNQLNDKENQIEQIEQELETIRGEFENAYNEGYEEGKKEAFNIINFVRQIILMVDTILQIEILPFVKLWYIVAIPLIIGVVKFVLSWWR